MLIGWNHMAHPRATWFHCDWSRLSKSGSKEERTFELPIGVEDIDRRQPRRRDDWRETRRRSVNAWPMRGKSFFVLTPPKPCRRGHSGISVILVHSQYDTLGLQARTSRVERAHDHLATQDRTAASASAKYRLRDNPCSVTG